MLFLGAVCLCPALASAQSFEDKIISYEPVGSRVPEEYKVKGLNYHGFVFYPEMKIQPYYNDNIFLSETQEESDFVTNFIPKLKIEKKYGPHGFNFDLIGFASRHKDFDDENLKLYNVSADGNIHIARGLSFLYSAYEKRDVISRSEPGDTQFTTEPVNFNRHELSLGLSKQFNRLSLTLLGSTNRTTYENGVSRTTRLPVVFDDGDRTTNRAELVAEYDILGRSSDVPEHTLFASISHQRQDFDIASNAPGGVNPNNKETGFLAGIVTKYKGLIYGKAGIGYFARNFEAGKDVKKLDIDVNLSMVVTPKLTVNFAAGRDVDQDNSFLTGLVNTQGSAGFDYELLHNWFAGANFIYKDKEFLGAQSGRQDRVYESSVYTRYLISPKLEGQLELNHNARSSNAVGADYDQNIIMMTLIGRL